MDNHQDLGSIKKGIVLVLIANLINLAIGLINGFILPKMLSVESYADIKTYQLYISFIGALALGYSDGIYLKYGGRPISAVSDKEINTCRTNLLISQSIATFIFLFFGIIQNNMIILLFAISIVPLNIASAYKNLFQATGEFAAYSKTLNITSVVTLFVTLVLLFALDIQEGFFYILAMVAVDYLILIILEIKLASSFHYKFTFIASADDFSNNVKSGFILMLGNFSNILMTGIDRWFVKLLLSVNSFAYYSFAVSTENLINVFITPVITTMYNYICRNVNEYSTLRRIKKICLIFSLFLISSAYPLKFILQNFLNKYINSQYIIFILFSTEVFYMIIKGVYVNVYKALKKQKLYLQQMSIVVVVGIILNAIAYVLTKSNEGIAIATLISSICWYLICSFSVKELRPDLKEYALLLPLIVFWCSGIFLDPIMGFFIYICSVLICCYIFDKQDFYTMIQIVSSNITKRLKKT